MPILIVIWLGALYSAPIPTILVTVGVFIAWNILAVKRDDIQY